MSITFSSCFYIIKSKFDSNTYIDWMTNFLSIVNNFNLIIYTDENSIAFIPQGANENPRIKIVIKPIEQFYNYKYKDYWIENHKQNSMLNSISCWELNMLWSEKIWFVKETVERKYFDTEFYGWCDIGYFRNRDADLHTNFLSNWPSREKIDKLDKNKIYYACVRNDSAYVSYLYKIVNNKNSVGLPIEQIPPYQNSIAGGFFLLYKDMVHWWAETFETKLVLYFKNSYLVKDDQIIIVDCILSELTKFSIIREQNPLYDNWFMFQRVLNV
jgi:hypothetical protein